MTTDAITEVKKSVQISEWKQEYEAYHRSGMNVRKWCEAQGIATSSFYHRLRRIRESLCEEYIPENDHAVVPVKHNSSAVITVEAAGISVSINGNATPESIRAVIEAMKSC